MYHTEEEKYKGKKYRFRESRGDKRQQKLEEERSVMLVEQMHNSVWPNTNIDVFLKLTDACDVDCLDTRHGGRHETLLHR